MSSKITGKEYPLLKIFSSDFEYHIPEYQRPYAWTSDEAGKLFDDLYDFYLSESGDNYFLGTVVLVKEDNNPRADVIDGQQRLTTLSILFSVLAETLTAPDAVKGCKDLLQEPGQLLAGIPPHPRLYLRHLDQAFFNRYIQATDIPSLLALDPSTLSTEAQQHIQQNCSILKERFADTFGGAQDKLLDFSAFLLNRCFLVVVSTDSQDSAFRIFSVMNSRGLDLLPIDIIKSEVIGKIPKTEQTSYTDRWEALENLVGRDGFNEVFTHTRTIFAQERPKKSLLDEFREFVVNRTTPKGLIDDILTPYTKAYFAAKNAQYSSVSHAAEVNNLLYWLNKIENYDWMPSAIKFLAEHPNDPDYTLWFFQKLERLAAYLLVTAQDVNHRVDRYKWVLAEMSGNSSRNLSSPLQTIELTAAEQRRFIECLDGNIYAMTSRRRNYIVQRLDSFLAAGGAQYDAKIFTIEHVLPQNPAPNSEWLQLWPDAAERALWLNRVANLVPLTRQHNAAAQNYDFATKKQSYFQTKGGVTSYALTTQVINCTSWTPDLVKQRQKDLLSLFCSKWELSASLPDAPDVVFHLAIRDSNATGVAGSGTDFIVKAGSRISADTTPSCHSTYLAMRNDLIQQGVIVNRIFTRDHTFDSVSAAAVVVGGRSANGRKEWATLDGQPYGKIIGR